MTNIFYDTEFVDDGRTIELVSIGMVCNDEFLYCIVADDNTIDRVAAHPWLSKNVLPHLPVKITYDHHRQVIVGTEKYTPIKYWEWDEAHPDYLHVRPRKAITARVRRFILARPDPQLWAWYGAYDHVALAQLFGSMVDLPHGIPMWTNDLKQECVRLGNPRMPEPAKNAHNALADAAWLAAAHALLTGADDA